MHSTVIDETDGPFANRVSASAKREAGASDAGWASDCDSAAAAAAGGGGSRAIGSVGSVAAVTALTVELVMLGAAALADAAFFFFAMVREIRRGRREEGFDGGRPLGTAVSLETERRPGGRLLLLY